MLYKSVNILTLKETINNISEQVNTWTNKFTENGVLASFLTIGLFLFACLAINHFANK